AGALLSPVRCAPAFSCCFFSSRRRHTRFKCDWSSDVCSSDLRHRRTWSRDARVRRDRVRDRQDEVGRQQLALSANLRAAAADARSEERRVGKEESARGQAAKYSLATSARCPALTAPLSSEGES